MTEMEMDMLTRMYHYNRWANNSLLTICAGLTEEQLLVDAPGVAGNIREIARHLVGAEGGYIRRLTGSLPWADDVDVEAMSMEEIVEMAEVSGSRFIEFVSEVDFGVTHDVEISSGPFRFYNWTVVLQALYHGIEHRTQIKSLLTKIGIEHPEHAAWDYTMAEYG